MTPLSDVSKRVLCLPELLDAILNQLENADLARMARLTTFAHYASIKLLWTGRDIIKGLSLWLHLNQLFPPGLVEERTSNKRWEFTRPPQEEDWIRFKHYSVYATNINISSCKFSSEYFEIFRDRSNDLFPRLRALGFEWSSQAKCYKKSEWILLAGSSLKELRVTDGWYSAPPLLQSWCLESIQCLLQELPLRTPYLMGLMLPCFSGVGLGVGLTRGLATQLASTLLSLPHLDDISWLWPDLPDLVVRTIALHQPLKGVNLSSGPLYPTALSPPLFPSLIRLGFQKGSAGALVSLLKSLSRMDCLDRVSLKLPNHRSVDEIPSISRAISFLSHATSLKDIEITFQGDPMDVGWSCFRPLLQCRSVVNFGLYTSAPVGLYDGGLLELARSWPDLESLNILEVLDEGIEFVPTCTFLGLAHLAKTSPKLTSIGLEVSLQMQEAGAVTPGVVNGLLSSELSSISRVNRLDLGASKFEVDDIGTDYFLEPRTIARLFRKLFPAVSSKGLFIDWEGAQDGGLWGCVLAFLEEMDDAKEQQAKHLREIKSREGSDFTSPDISLYLSILSFFCGVACSVIGSLTRERDQLAAECARLRCALEARGGGPSLMG